MQTKTCLELFLLMYASKGYFSEKSLNNFNKIANKPITESQLNELGFFRYCGTKSRDIFYLRSK